MQSKRFFLTQWILLVAFFAATANGLSTQNFNADWKFTKLKDTTINDAGFQSRMFNDAGWSKVSLPHTANIEPLVVNNQWQGICWYRKSFMVEPGLQSKKLFVQFDGAMNKVVVWINGKKAAEDEGGYLPLVIDITNLVDFGKENTIAVRLDNTDNPVTGPKPLKILDFNMYGGLYRNAWFIVKDKVHITNANFVNKVAGGGIFITYPKVSEQASVVAVNTDVRNSGTIPAKVQVVQTIQYKNKSVVVKQSALREIAAGADAVFADDLTVANAKLWSPAAPNLYTLQTKVLVNGVETDSETTRFGIRAFEFKGNDLYINGVKTFLRGVNRHQEYPFVGYALSDNAQYRDAKKIKDGGFDYIRLSHYPQSPAFLDACDELGLVVLDAILGWQYYADNDLFRNFCYTSAARLIRRDRNHACILGWEVSLNETQMPVSFMAELHRITHTEYPGKNVYSAGWMNDVYDIYLQARQHRIMHYEPVQTKPYSVSEYGDWEYYSTNAGLNQDKMDKKMRYETSSRQKREFGEMRMLQQCKNVQESHNDNFNTPAFSDSYWVMYDYNRGYHDEIEYSGVMDIYRLPKFAYYFYQSQQSPVQNKVVKIATFWTAQSPLNVKVFSNCDEVAFYVNNKLVAKQKPDVDKISGNLAHPPFTFNVSGFEPGKVNAVGYIAGKKVAEDVVNTPGKAVGLKLWLDESGRKPQAGCNDVLFLYIAAVDANGTVVPDFAETIQLSTNGSAEILNVGEIKAEAGIATALVRIGQSEGPRTLNALVKGLKSGTIKF